jgi:hypothetical protein
MTTRKALKMNGGDVDTDPKKMPLGTKIWIYLRHSPWDNQTIESQEAAIRNLVKDKNWIIDRVFRDIGLSGKSADTRRDFEKNISRKKSSDELSSRIGFTHCPCNQTNASASVKVMHRFFIATVGYLQNFITIIE